jgi:hypothetical protein
MALVPFKSFGGFSILNGNVSTTWTSGSGSPEGVVTANKGSLYSDSLNGDVYKKQTGSSTTGWISISSSGSVTADQVAETASRVFISPAQKLIVSGISGTNTGDETATTIRNKLGAASALNNGYLSSTDFTTFNNKQNQLDFIPEDTANKSTSTSLGTSNTLYPTQNAVKSYVDAFIGVGYTHDFIQADWAGPSLGYYSILLTHSLETSLIEIEVLDIGSQPVEINREIIDTNQISIKVPSDPDLRFDGTIWIKKN